MENPDGIGSFRRNDGDGNRSIPVSADDAQAKYEQRTDTRDGGNRLGTVYSKKYARKSTG